MSIKAGCHESDYQRHTDQTHTDRSRAARGGSVVNARECADAIEAAMTTRDLEGLLAVYADDVVFNSPVTAVEFRGKSEVADLMTQVLAGFETWERTFVLADDRQCVFGARGRIGGRDVELAELIRVDPDGRVAEIVIHGRPLAGVAAIAAVAAPPLAARRGRTRALLARLLSRGLPAALASGDRIITRLAR
jgi:SnoaL-like domain